MLWKAQKPQSITNYVSTRQQLENTMVEIEGGKQSTPGLGDRWNKLIIPIIDVSKYNAIYGYKQAEYAPSQPVNTSFEACNIAPDHPISSMQGSRVVPYLTWASYQHQTHDGLFIYNCFIIGKTNLAIIEEKVIISQ